MSSSRKLNKREKKGIRSSSKRKAKTKTTNFTESLSEESSFDENYLNNYSSESGHSDGELKKPVLDYRRYAELMKKKGPSGRERHVTTDRLNDFFSKEGSTLFPDLASVLLSISKENFVLADFLKNNSSDSPQPDQASTSASKVRPPDVNNVPEAVLRLWNEEDVIKNHKVLEYLKQIDEYEKDLNRRLAANEHVPKEEVEVLHKARDAILKQFGYDFADKEEMKREERRARKRQTRKNEFPAGVSVTSSSDSEDSEKLLREEVTRRVLKKGPGDFDELEIADLIKHSPRWKSCIENEMSNKDMIGKIEKMTKLTDKMFIKKTD